MNRVILIGNLVADPEIRHTTGSQPLCIANYRLAVQRHFKVPGNPTVDYFPCVAFGKSAEFAESYLTKGKRIGVEGRLQTRNYKNRDGATVYVTEIIVDNQDVAENKTQDVPPAPENAATDFMERFTAVDDDELPFD